MAMSCQYHFAYMYSLWHFTVLSATLWLRARHQHPDNVTAMRWVPSNGAMDVWMLQSIWMNKLLTHRSEYVQIQFKWLRMTSKVSLLIRGTSACTVFLRFAQSRSHTDTASDDFQLCQLRHPQKNSLEISFYFCHVRFRHDGKLTTTWHCWLHLWFVPHADIQLCIIDFHVLSRHEMKWNEMKRKFHLIFDCYTGEHRKDFVWRVLVLLCISFDIFLGGVPFHVQHSLQVQCMPRRYTEYMIYLPIT